VAESYFYKKSSSPWTVLAFGIQGFRGAVMNSKSKYCKFVVLFYIVLDYLPEAEDTGVHFTRLENHQSSVNY
jgi:hypothetical protein